MKVRILELSTKELTQALIVDGNDRKLPSINDNWVFNFSKHAKNNVATAYIIIREDTPDIIEGCMIFSLHETFGPFMDYLEVAPHNRGNSGKYKYVAGCLIAFACGLSFEVNSWDKGILTFQAFGKDQKQTKKLETWYKKKYGAVKNPWGYMEIHHEAGKVLIEEYLYRGTINNEK